MIFSQVVIFYDENYRYCGSQTIELDPDLSNDLNYLNELKENYQRQVESEDRSVGYRILTQEELSLFPNNLFTKGIFGPDKVQRVPTVIFGLNTLDIALSEKRPDLYNKIEVSLGIDWANNTKEENNYVANLKDIKIQINDSKILLMDPTVSHDPLITINSETQVKDNNLYLNVNTPGVYKIELYDNRVTTLAQSIFHVNVYNPSIDPYDEYLELLENPEM